MSESANPTPNKNTVLPEPVLEEHDEFTTGEEADIKAAATEIVDKKGDKYDVQFFRVKDGTSANIFDFLESKNLFNDVVNMHRVCFPDPENKDPDLKVKFAGYNAVDIIRTKNGEPVGYHVYKFKNIPGYDNPPAKGMYTGWAGVLPTYNGRGLTKISRLPAIDIEDPDVIAGSTNVPAIYTAQPTHCAR